MAKFSVRNTALSASIITLCIFFAQESFAGPSTVYVSQSRTGQVVTVSPDGTISGFASTPSGTSPSGLAFDSTGNLYAAFANSTGGGIEKITPLGAASVFATGITAGALAFDASGNLYAVNVLGNDIFRYAPDGTRFGFAAGIANPGGIAFDKAGNLYVATNLLLASPQYNRIDKYAPSGAYLGAFASTGLFQPSGLAFDGSGNLFVANSDGHIEEFTTGGVGSVFPTGFMLSPEGLAFDASGNLYVADFGYALAGGGAVYEFAPDGTRTVVASGYFGPYAMGLGGPMGVAFAPDEVSVPEPRSIVLLLVGLVGVAMGRRRSV